MNKAPKDKILQYLLRENLLIQSAWKSGIESSEAYKQKLNLLKRDLALTLWMEQEAKKIEESTTDEELKKFYENNRDNFKTPSQLKARHILVKSKEEAEDIIKRLNSAKDVSGEFIKLAQEKSIGPSARVEGI